MRAWAEALYRHEAPRAVLWLPVLFGLGVWAYFAAPSEPPGWVAALPLGPIAALSTGLPRRAGAWAYALALGLLAVTAGASVALVHARAAAAPVLAEPLHETVDGRVVALSQSAAGAPRVTLDRVTLYGLPVAATPARIRVSLVDMDLATAPRPGERIRVYARLFPPGGPVEPGAHDFARTAWFARIGAVGFAKGPVLHLGPGSRADRFRIWLAERRAAIADGLRAALPGAEGAFAAAILVGDRSGIQETDATALRAANLAHLLAISGLHMGILCGLVFGAVRFLAAAVPQVGLFVNGKKLAALAALCAGAGYLVLSGATVPTQRAFAMAAVALLAVLLDRPAITLRALGLAAVVVLAVRPVSLLDPGFQMSFAATAALVAVYEALRGLDLKPRGGRATQGVFWRVGGYIGALLLTSFVAGLATAPYAAAHFNRLPLYGLPANLVAVPVMGLWIAPMAVIAAVAWPLGLSALPLAAMGVGISQVLSVAHAVAAWPDAVRMVAAAPLAALWLVTIGGLWLALWGSWLRVAGALPLALGLWLWADPPPRPLVSLAPGARLVGVVGPKGRVVDHPRAQSFAAEVWLRRDGDPASQEVAAERPGLAQG
ncbi:MAG: ComEC/Rec2 family competence protein, partial [Pikeienuella sp.]